MPIFVNCEVNYCLLVILSAETDLLSVLYE